MFLVKEGLPEDDELVLCTVTAIQYHSVFVKLDEYGHQGMIHISEISPGRIRNIRDFVAEGKKIICKVLRIDKIKGHIDLSLRRVNESQKRAKNNSIKQEQLAENIIKFLAQKESIKPEELFQRVAAQLIPERYQNLYAAFEDVVAGNLALESVIDAKLAKELTGLILERIKPPKVTIKGNVSLTSYAPDGVSIIKGIFKKCSSVKGDVTISFSGAGVYRIIVTASNYKEAESILEKLIKIIRTSSEKEKVSFGFTRLE